MPSSLHSSSLLKLFPLQVSDKIYCCRSGSAADTQAIADYVKFYLDLQENETNEDPTVEVCRVYTVHAYFRVLGYTILNCTVSCTVLYNSTLFDYTTLIILKLIILTSNTYNLCKT